MESGGKPFTKKVTLRALVIVGVSVIAAWCLLLAYITFKVCSGG